MKSICFCLSILLIFIFNTGSAQSPAYSLRVQDEQGIPLAAATVSVKGLLPVTTNSNGIATINSTNSTLNVLVTYTGFLQLDTTLSAGNHLLTLRNKAMHLEPVEVKLLRAGTNAPFTKTNLDAETISKNNTGTDIPMLLAQTPSVVAHSDAGNGIGYTGLRIRGTDATRINMTINGIPYNDAESQGIFLVNLPDLLSSATSIQVQRGVGTSSNGAGAFGASLNLSTHEFHAKPHGSVAASYGSFNSNKLTLKGGTGLLGKHFTLDGRLSTINSDGYIERAKTNLQSGMFTAGWWADRTTIKANAILGKEKTYQAWYGVSESDLKTNRRINYAGTEKADAPYDNETDNYWQNHYQLIINHKAANNWQLNTSFFTTTGKGYYEQYKAEETLQDYGLTNVKDNDGNSVEETDLIRRLWLDNIFFGQVFSVQQIKQKQELGFGGGWNIYDGNHYGNIIWSKAQPSLNYQWYNNDARKTDINLYGKLQRQLKAGLYGFADLQYRFVNYNMDGFRNAPTLQHKVEYHFLNPKLGLLWRGNRVNGYLSYAIANKEPNRDDFEVSSATLPLREQLHDVEFNIAIPEVLPSLGLQVTNYYMYYFDQLILTGKINDVGAYTRINTPNSYRLGSEVELAYTKPVYKIAYTGTFSRNRVKSFTEYIDDYDAGGQQEIVHNNSPLALSPSIIQQLMFTYLPHKTTELQWISRHTGKQYLDNTGNSMRKLDPFVVSDLRISFTPAIKSVKQIRFTLQLNNLFNTLYEPNGYTFSYRAGGELTTENYYFPMAGFNMMAAVNIAL